MAWQLMLASVDTGIYLHCASSLCISLDIYFRVLFDYIGADADGGWGESGGSSASFSMVPPAPVQLRGRLG